MLLAYSQQDQGELEENDQSNAHLGSNSRSLACPLLCQHK
jgi:hypothetical protein